MAHVFCFNDWSGRQLDHCDPNKRESSLLSRGFSGQEILVVTVSLGIASCLLLGMISLRLLGFAFLIIVMGIIYSFPVARFQGKRIPLLSTVLHVGGVLLTFLIGYGLIHRMDQRGVLIGVYFAMLISAGHLVQEVQDCQGDRLNQIRTHTIVFGQRTMFVVAFTMFSLSFAYLYWLARGGWVLPSLKYLVLLYPALVGLFWQADRAGLTFGAVRRLRSRYRMLFAVVAVAFCLSGFV